MRGRKSFENRHDFTLYYLSFRREVVRRWLVCALLVASLVVGSFARGADLYLYPNADPVPRYAPRAKGVTTFPKRINRN
jgi:hypothetical protein